MQTVKPPSCCCPGRVSRAGKKKKNRLKTEKNWPICILLMLLLRISDSQWGKTGLSVLHKGILTRHEGSNRDLFVTRQSVTLQSEVLLTSDASIFMRGSHVVWAFTVSFSHIQTIWARRTAESNVIDACLLKSALPSVLRWSLDVKWVHQWNKN